MSDVRPEWDEEKATTLIGRVVLVGITYDEVEGARLEQFHGTVTSVDPQRGIGLSLLGRRTGDRFTLPPDLTSLSLAAPGEYRLRATGEIVTDPDYLSVWTRTPPA